MSEGKRHLCEADCFHSRAIDHRHSRAIDHRHFRTIDHRHFRATDHRHSRAIDHRHFRTTDHRHSRAIDHRHFRTTDHRHSRVSGNPLRVIHETTCRIHSRQPPQRYALHWRDQQSCSARVATQTGSGRGIHQKVPGSHIGLLRATWGHGYCHHPRKAAQEMESRLEDRAYRKTKPDLARSLARHCHSLMRHSCINLPSHTSINLRSHKPTESFPRKRESRCVA
jgi:hypothetical protein